MVDLKVNDMYNFVKVVLFGVYISCQIPQTIRNINFELLIDYLSNIKMFFYIEEIICYITYTY
jgi:hypothetical protein